MRVNEKLEKLKIIII